MGNMRANKRFNKKRGGYGSAKLEAMVPAAVVPTTQHAEKKKKSLPVENKMPAIPVVAVQEPAVVVDPYRQALAIFAEGWARCTFTTKSRRPEKWASICYSRDIIMSLETLARYSRHALAMVMSSHNRSTTTHEHAANCCMAAYLVDVLAFYHFYGHPDNCSKTTEALGKAAAAMARCLPNHPTLGTEAPAKPFSNVLGRMDHVRRSIVGEKKRKPDDFVPVVYWTMKELDRKHTDVVITASKQLNELTDSAIVSDLYPASELYAGQHVNPLLANTALGLHGLHLEHYLQEEIFEVIRANTAVFDYSLSCFPTFGTLENGPWLGTGPKLAALTSGDKLPRQVLDIQAARKNLMGRKEPTAKPTAEPEIQPIQQSVFEQMLTSASVGKRSQASPSTLTERAAKRARQQSTPTSPASGLIDSTRTATSTPASSVVRPAAVIRSSSDPGVSAGAPPFVNEPLANVIIQNTTEVEYSATIESQPTDHDLTQSTPPMPPFVQTACNGVAALEEVLTGLSQSFPAGRSSQPPLSPVTTADNTELDRT